jgi:hypothetical protein
MAETALDPLVGTSGTRQELITQKLAERPPWALSTCPAMPLRREPAFCTEPGVT